MYCDIHLQENLAGADQDADEIEGDIAHDELVQPAYDEDHNAVDVDAVRILHGGERQALIEKDNIIRKLEAENMNLKKEVKELRRKQML